MGLTNPPDLEIKERLIGWGVVVLLALIAGILGLWLGNAEAQLQPAISDEEGIRCVIGEASNQGEKGMEAVADALQNRGTTKGVYGCKSAHIDKEPTWVYRMAERAWNRAKNANLTHLATNWENLKFGEPYWAKSMVRTVCIKDHCFYREHK